MLRVEVETTGDLGKVAGELHRKAGPYVRRSLQWAARDLLRGIRKGMASTRIPGLINSWSDSEPEERDGEMVVQVSSTHPMAYLREYGTGILPGGKITPGKSLARSGPNKGQPTRALAVPVEDNLTAAGVSRGAPYLADEHFGKKLEFIPGHGGGPAVLGRWDPDAERFNVLFVLLRSVKFGPRPVVRPAREATVERLWERIRASYEKAGRP